MANVELCRVSKAYPGGVKALDEVDLEARDGEILVLFLERLSSGEIHIGGKRADHLPPWHRNVAMIFQGCVLYPHLTVEQNLLFGLEPGRGSWIAWIGNRLANLAGRNRRGRSVHSGDQADDLADRPRAARDQVRQTAKLLGIEAILDRYPRQLSGGERQRVALGRAFVRQPAVFLLDEPWSNVDVRLRQSLRNELRRLREQMGGAMILVTHDHAEALELGDRVAVLQEGAIHQIGTPTEILETPRTSFVSEFVGGRPTDA
jgi:multiple sugar transport system ATP-binding protein